MVSSVISIGFGFATYNKFYIGHKTNSRLISELPC